MLLWPATMCTLLAGYHMPAAAYPPSQLQHASRAACPPVMMPKGDGKQRRPKQAPKPPPEAAAPPPESPAAGRVSSDSQISVLDCDQMRWLEPTIAGTPPPAREDTSLVYDSKNSRMVLFGGWSDDLQEGRSQLPTGCRKSLVERHFGS